MTTSVHGQGVVVHGTDAEVLEFPGGSLMSLLAEGVGTAATITVHRSLLRSGAQGASPHHHETTTELIFVVSGSLELLVGERSLSVGAGDLAVIPPGVTHAFRAAAGCDADVLDVVTPGVERFDMFRQLSQAALGVGGARPSLDDPTNYDTYADDRPEWGVPSRPTARAYP